jgi:hypothetical protein
MAVMRELGFTRIAGGSHSHIKRRLAKENIDTSHFLGQGWNRGTHSPAKLSADAILVYDRLKGSRTAVVLLRYALDQKGMPRKCSLCGVGETWNQRPLVLEVDHIDDDFLNNTLSNLRFLCPNCHAQETKG